MERSKAERFLHQRDREKYVIAHVALREILAGYVGIRPEALRIETGEFGKPSLGKDSPIQFNLSHSGDLALIGVQRQGKIGVDIEQVRPEAVADGVAERFFSAGELRKLRTLEGEEAVKAFFRCWTRKEAYLKAIGCGISELDLSASEVTLLADEKAAILKPTPQDQGHPTWSVFHLEPAPGYIAAVVTDRKPFAVKMMEWMGIAP